MKNKTIFLLLALSFLSVSIYASEYHVKKSEKNLVKFISDAPIENFEGVTNNIDGYLYFGENLTAGSQLYFEVDLRTIDTGIGLRNRHMRENYLETDKFPMAAYSGKIIKAEKTGDKVFKVMVEGEMNIHGVRRPQNIEGVVDLSNEIMKISSVFNVKLTAYKIEVPKLMFLKINENMELHVDFYLEKVN